MGKPPISDNTMRKMYDAMEHLRSAQRDPSVWKAVPRAVRASVATEPESLLAGVLSQLHRRDTLAVAGEHPLINIATGVFYPNPVASLHTVRVDGTDEECAAMAAGMAKRTLEEHRSPQPVTVALLRSFPALTSVLAWMERQDLPLLLVAKDALEPRGITERRIRSTKVPILPVDAADTVAVCRAMQEALLRARNGWGGAVIHAISLPGSSTPLGLMRQRMQARGLFPDGEM